jgi:hypothetical protein
MATATTDPHDALIDQVEPNGLYEVIDGSIVEKTTSVYESWLAGMLFGILHPYARRFRFPPWKASSTAATCCRGSACRFGTCSIRLVNQPDRAVDGPAMCFWFAVNVPVPVFRSLKAQPAPAFLRLDSCRETDALRLRNSCGSGSRAQRAREGAVLARNST